MASDEMRKKWGTIFMGDREASVEQLSAMRERVDHDRIQKERAEDYMERVRARAADRAREILGQAYTERQKVLDEAKGEAAVQKRLAAQECAKIKSEGESIRAEAQAELDKARAELDEAARIKDGAKEEGYQAGMQQAGLELQEFRAELGQSIGALMRAIERERKEILKNWREDLVELTRAAVEAGTGLVLQKEHQAILRSLVYKSLDYLENRSSITCRVHPRDEETVSDLFRAARERFPELRQWTVSGDENMEPGGMVVESGTGSVDLRRSNFREMVDNILEHLGLPEQEWEEAKDQEMAHLVEKEVAHIASLTPEPDQPEPSLPANETPVSEQESEEAPPQATSDEAAHDVETPLHVEVPAPEEDMPLEEPEDALPDVPTSMEGGQKQDGNPTLAELEEELFPLEEPGAAAEGDHPKAGAEIPNDNSNPVEEKLDSKILSEGGFL